MLRVLLNLHSLSLLLLKNMLIIRIFLTNWLLTLIRLRERGICSTPSYLSFRTLHKNLTQFLQLLLWVLKICLVEAVQLLQSSTMVFLLRCQALVNWVGHQTQGRWGNFCPFCYKLLFIHLHKFSFRWKLQCLILALGLKLHLILALVSQTHSRTILSNLAFKQTIHLSTLQVHY